MSQPSIALRRIANRALLLVAVALSGCSAPPVPDVHAVGATPAVAPIATGVGSVQDAGKDVAPRESETPRDQSLEPAPPAGDVPAQPPAKNAGRFAASEIAAEDALAAVVAASDAEADVPVVPMERAAPVEAAEIAARPLPPSALLAEDAPSFAFADDAAGGRIGAFFALPRPIDPWGAETDFQERPWLHSAEEPPRDVIPPAEFAVARVLPSETPVRDLRRPVVDLPVLAADLETVRPARPDLPLAPKTALAGPDPGQLPALPALGRMNEGAITLADDATNAPLLQAMLSPLSLSRAGIPFVPPRPIDPYARQVEFKNGPPDNDPPARSTAPLPAPVLP